MEPESTVLLFDLDETLTHSCQVISDEVKECLLNLKNKGYHLAVVSGSDFQKVQFQLKQDFLKSFNFVFCENGTQTYKDGSLVHSESIIGYLTDPFLNEVLNYVLRYISYLDVPKKRGCFVEMRKSLINMSPIGRNCSEFERNEFYELDCKLKIRQKMRDDLDARFKDSHPKLRFSLGGKISIDCFPEDWTKEFCLKFLESYKTIHFFGDMTNPGGNDYELFVNPKVVGHKVTNYFDTMKQLRELFLYNESKCVP